MPPTPPDFLRSAINQTAADLARAIPADRDSALQTLLQAFADLPHPALVTGSPDPFTGVTVAGIGSSRALQLLLQAPNSATDALEGDLEEWARSFLARCDDLARAELVLAHVETGFMRLVPGPGNRLDARIAQRATPLRWRERVDDLWWADYEGAREPLPSAPPIARATALIDRLAYRQDLPAHGAIGSIDLDLVGRCLAALVVLAGDRPVTVHDRHTLLLDLAERLTAPETAIADVLDVLTLDSDNAAWHAAVPGISDPPLVRLPTGALALPLRNLTGNPVRFVARELRRRDPSGYHSAAAAREDAFRADLYRLFSHRRFVASPGSIELRRAKGDIRTDIDAAIFDRKSNTLALFELKANEPFARSTAELVRTQENCRAAGRQVAGALDWINRHGADEILNRIDRRSAKTFRVQKVQAFVLGRHLVEGDDRRAVWATWPQLLRVLGDTPVEDLGANPVVALAGRLQRDRPLLMPGDVRESTVVDLGSLTFVVSPMSNRE